MTIRRRVNVWDLEPWDDTLVWYARAVRELQGRSLVDPTSFAYQAAVHDRRLASGPGEPPHDEQRRFWRQCQHGTWFFLPWHRIYVAYFEQLVASTIASRGGPRDWALPYWNPSDPRRPETRTLPPAFREERLPDCTPNPLRIAERDDGVNDGDEVAGQAQVSLECLCEPEFAARPSGGGTGFGGPQGPAHHGTRRGQLERQPHGGIHSGIGGAMGFPETAALDPIFFLHHANIDRLWVVWRRRDARHADPTDRAWLDQTFAFHDANGQPVSHAVCQWVDPAKAPLPFEYDDVSDPMAGQCAEGLFTWSTTRKASVELASAPGPVRLARGPVRIALRRAPGGATQSKYDGIARAFLDLEEISGRGVSGSYGVFLSYAGSPAAETRVGVLPMFGLRPGRDDDRGEHRHPDFPPHPMHLTYELDVTGVIVRNGVLDIDGLVITIAPEPRAGRGLEDGDGEPPSIARIRLTLA